VPTTFTADAGRQGNEISPLWFGHNLEHTRSCVWQGLSAQLIRNRKFAGLPQRDGAARDWYALGPAESWRLLEATWAWNGTEGEAYTTHFHPRVGPPGQRQRVESFRSGAPCGIGQRGIVLIGGRAYEGRVVLRADRDLAVRVTVSAAEAEVARVTARPGSWTEAAFRFAAARTESDARLEITFDGPGALFVGAVSLLPADHYLGMRRDVIELLKEISVPILRWPGGNFAGDYHWQDGLLPVDQRAPLPSTPETLPHTNGFDFHEIGTNEFIALCRELGAEPFITINMGLEGPEEAAAWVEYCNGGPDTKWGKVRAERGHPEPYNVKYWTLGNEMGYSHMKGPNTPGGYTEMAVACARAMRQVDPSLHLTASTGWSKEWYEGVLAAEEDYFDGISAHIYYRLVKDFGGEEGRREFRRLVTAPPGDFRSSNLVNGQQGDRRLTVRDIRDLVSARPRGRKDIGIAFDEWNVWYAWYRRPGVVEGIHGAVMLNVLCREAGNLGVNIGAFFEPVNEGAILVEPDSARLTPLGRVMALFRPHQGGRLVPVSPSPSAGDLDVAASFSAAKGELTVTLVNQSPDESREAEIAVARAAPVGEARGVLLSSSGFQPGSDFQENSMEVRRRGSSALVVSLPKHSVARVQVACRS